MMQVQIKAHFNKQTKDSKKELVQFHVKGDDERKQELDAMCREVVELTIVGLDSKIIAEYNKKTKDSKKTVLEFVVKGDTSAAQTFEFYKKAGSTVDLTITESQLSIEDLQGDGHEGIEYNVNSDGTVDVPDGQMSLDEVAASSDDVLEDATKPDNVADLQQERSKRGRQKKEAVVTQDPGEPDSESPPVPMPNDDELPF